MVQFSIYSKNVKAKAWKLVCLNLYIPLFCSCFTPTCQKDQLYVYLLLMFLSDIVIFTNPFTYFYLT